MREGLAALRLGACEGDQPSVMTNPFQKHVRTGALAIASIVVLGGLPLIAQETPAATPAQTQTQTQTQTDQTTVPTQTVSNQPTFNGRGKKKAAPADAKVVASKDTKKAAKAAEKTKAAAGLDADAKLPDKQLYDKAMLSISKGRYDVARLDLQTMLNTYPDSQYQMKAKLAIADSWYKEGGSAALTQAESEYADFRVFFPNAPEAAEAQMRIGDIYFRQMDRPDRDYSKAMHAEEEYRRMLTDYPNAPANLTVQAKQRLRDVQEVLASRDASIAAFYATHENWAATIARYQTVADTYPLYSHMDDVLIGIGDAYEAQARFVRANKAIPEGPKAKLEALYDGEAADYYRRVVLEHSAAPHVEDARDRLAAMNLPIPQPSPEQIAASTALENSRASYKLSDRATLMFLHKPDTVLASRAGEPTMTDPKQTTAPMVSTKVKADFTTAFAATPAAPASTPAPAPSTEAVATPAPAAAAPAAPAAPLALSNVTEEDAAPAGSAPVDTSVTAAKPAYVRAGGAAGMNVEILDSKPDGAAAETNYGLKAVGPASDALPPAEKAAAAPDRPNEINAPQAPTQVATGKKTKAAFDKKDESSSKHKKKKGIAKVNPF